MQPSGILAGQSLHCKRLPRVRRYLPSQWEEEWYPIGQGVGVNDSLPCTNMNVQKARIDAWLKGVEESHLALGAGMMLSEDVFSRYEFENPCRPDAPFVSYIEPLVGHFRWVRARERSTSLPRLFANVAHPLLFVGILVRRIASAKIMQRQRTLNPGRPGATR
jgi:hypothetical protein